MNKQKLCDVIEEYADGEEIEAVTMGAGDEDFLPESLKDLGYFNQPTGVLLQWDEAKKFLDYDVDWYTADPTLTEWVTPVVAWTKNWIIFIASSEDWQIIFPYKLPRHPRAFRPQIL